MIYDIRGNEMTNKKFTAYDRFKSEIGYSRRRDSITDAVYTVIRIPKINSYGDVQYPFVLWKNYPNGGNESALEMNTSENYLVAINGGRFQLPWGAGVTLTGLPCGTVIQNSVVLQQGSAQNSNPEDYVLTIDDNGDIGYANFTDSASALVTNGVVSAVTGFAPVLIDYEEFNADNDADSPRQILGQYDNGDYVILTTEGRNHQGGGYFTTAQIKRLCGELGIKTAFQVDGGGSVETVIGKKQLNSFYDNTLGRKVPTYIVFNGSTVFGAPQ